jgi:hypothetical protein
MFLMTQFSYLLSRGTDKCAIFIYMFYLNFHEHLLIVHINGFRVIFQHMHCVIYANLTNPPPKKPTLVFNVIFLGF